MLIKKHILKYSLIILLFTINKDLFAQKNQSEINFAINNFCSNDVINKELRKNPNYLAIEENFNKQIAQHIQLRRRNPTIDTLITLPIVVHIINTNPAAIANATIMSGIADLNDAFSKSGAYSASVGADTKIAFCLAQTDPQGGISTGITRTTSYMGTHLNMDNEDSKLKGLIQWDPTQYINIWLISSIDAEAFADFTCGSWYRLGVGGYATLPPGGGASDGIVITGFGKLLAHEMGHYLGLYHTFQGGCSNFSDCTIEGDRVCDTPPDNSVRPSASCASPQNSCNTDTLASHSNNTFFTDVPDQIANFMDYGNGACSNMFSQGQSDRMRAAINIQRSGLLIPKCNKPCADNIEANFTYNISYPIIGDLINFTNTSTGAVTNEWYVNDTLRATTTNFSYSFNEVGKFKVTLKAYNGGACFASYTAFPKVSCGVTARFYTNKKLLASKVGILLDSTIFTNNSYNAQSYQWLITAPGMTETIVSTTTNLIYTYLTPGTYLVRLVATNGSCADTSNYYSVPVQDPTPDGSFFNVNVQCFNQNLVRVNFCIANRGYKELPKNTPITFYDADPRIAGANKLGTDFLLPSSLKGGFFCTACYSHILNVAYNGLERIFLVFNDSGNTVPIMLPNSSVVETNYFNNVSATPFRRSFITKAICQGTSFEGYSTAGTYIDTFTSTVNGCDSTRTLTLTIKPTFNTTINASICQGDTLYGFTTSGTFINKFVSSNGCDSTRTLNLIVKPKFTTIVRDTICQGESIAGHTTTGTYTDVYTAINGCDSSRTLLLVVNPRKLITLNKQICQGDSFFVAKKFQKTTGIYTDSFLTSLKCDSLITTNLTVNPLPQPDLGINRGICFGDSLVLNPGLFTTYLWHNGSTLNTFTTHTIGKYVVKVTNIFSCIAWDSITVLKIHPLPVNFLPADTTLCNGNILQIKLPNYKTYNWSTNSTQNFIDITTTNTYSLRLTDRYDCAGTDSILVQFKNCIEIDIPNAFTPNGDRLNDEFKPLVPAPLKNYKMILQNRWGLKMYETQNHTQGWDGRYKGIPQTAEIYIYFISYTNNLNQNVNRKGTFVLLK